MLYLAQNEAFSPVMPASPARRNASREILLAPHEVVSLDATANGNLSRITSGCIALGQYLPDGRRQIFDILGPGRLFGFALPDSHECVAEALTYTVIERIRPGNSADSLASGLMSFLGRIQGHTILLGRKTAMERVATAVLDLARQFARRMSGRGQNHIAFTMFPTRADLADWLGLTVETVSRCLNAFKRRGLIDFTRPELVSILDRTELELIAEGRTTGLAA